MTRKWCGFLPQNLSAKEEWELLETCEAQARHMEELQPGFRPVKAPMRPAPPSRPPPRPRKTLKR